MKYVLILSTGLLAACATTTGTATARLGADPVVSGGTYSSGGGISVAVDVLESNGKTMVCGVWAQSRAQSTLTNGVEPRLLGSGSVSLGDAVLVRGLLFMQEVAPAADYAASEARCVVSDRPWQAGDEARRPSINIPAQVVHVEGDEMGYFTVTFRQTGPGAGAS
ncbi:hypothetical protein ROG8370_02272 [Roseovarius gaetbuli]|uniref:Lipoprotein n=1 Tax=Roseovarius gaetbuli TaxID=1356575 RepID=A0A1X6ZGU8_9RHOB|nr:hypothetical protein [Roseovarius gaetbuli]SLN51091.1 hypothetical protein ROG8370_02272 [Roseovarius gaetbuli]